MHSAPQKKRHWILLGFALLSLFLLLPAQAQRSNSTNSADSFSIELSSEAQEAINNGVTLSFDCEFAIRQSFWLFALSQEAKLHQFQLMRHALSNRYIVLNDDLQTPRIFRSIDEATNYIASQSMKLLESYNEADKPFSMKLSLNKFNLPGPMRLKAFTSSAWRLNTGWIAWRFAN